SISSVPSHHPSHTQICLLSLHDALPISRSTPKRRTTVSISHARVRGCFEYASCRASQDSAWCGRTWVRAVRASTVRVLPVAVRQDRKSTRLNSSHVKISYAVFCLKKKKK